ncbi:MDR family MFS transporter [Fodinicola acaciae]|uniref:MDR family MFS transporter n=1 Tax=Fodinicola acaciae TaxID=2681555 RepID=UPI0013D427F0|nr:MDR family MFS transporter [Fodinicola acaciae]
MSESLAKPAGDAKGLTLSHRQILVILSGLLLGMFLAALDQTIVSTAMRTVADKLDGQTAQAWVTTAYLITSTVSTPLYGKLSDMYGRKPFYLFAITIFVAGSLLSGIASDIYMLAAFRAVQGIGAGGLMSLAFAIVGDIVPPRQRGRYQAYFMAVFGTSSVLGPVVGGVLAGQDHILGFDGWRWIFLVNVPVGVLALTVVARVLNLPHTPRKARVDYLGAALLALAVVPLLTVAEQGNEWGWTSAGSLGLIAVGVVAAIAFVLWERAMGEDAILPLRLFNNSVFSVTSVMNFVVGMVMFGGIAAIPLYLQIVRGYSPTVAGFLSLPLMLGIMGSSFLSGQVMSRTGRYKVFPIVGGFFLLTGMLLSATLTPDVAIVVPMAYMMVIGAGLGLSMQTLIVAVQNAVPARDMGVSTSSAQFFRTMGGTFGTAVFLSVLFNSVAGNIRDRFTDASHTEPGALRQALAQLTGQQRELLAGGGGQSSLNDTSFIGQLPEVLKNVFLHGFNDSMSTVFLLAGLLAIPAIVLGFFVREIPLRTTAGISAAAQEDDAKAVAPAVH